jgi:hypothetical protein
MMKEIIEFLFITFIDILGWPIIVPFLVSIISWLVSNLNTLDQDLKSIKDFNAYGSNMDELIVREQKGGFYYHLPYAFLSNAIWGISTVNVNLINVQQGDIKLYSGFMVFYIILLLWSVAIILHSNVPFNIQKNITNYKNLKCHFKYAAYIFIIIRLLIYFLSGYKI